MLTFGQFDHQAGGRAIDLTGPRGRIEVDVQADPDQRVLWLLVAPLGFDQDAAEFSLFDLNIVGPLDGWLERGGASDGFACRDRRDDAQTLHLISAGSHDQCRVNALTRRRDPDTALRTTTGRLLVGDDRSAMRATGFGQTAGIIHGRIGDAEVVEFASDPCGREARANLVGVESLVVGQGIEFVAHGGRLAVPN